MTQRLAMLRILVFGYAAVWTTVRAPHLVDTVDLAPRRLDAVGPLWWLTEPMPAVVILVTVALTPIACAAAALGWKYRLSAPVAALGFLFLTTYRNSWGQLFHTENLAALHLCVLALVPFAAVSWSVSSSSEEHNKEHNQQREELSRFVVTTLSVLTVGTYFVAGVAKLRISGFAWIDGDVLRHHIAFDNARKELFGDPIAPFGATMLRNSWTLAPAAVAAIIVELTAPLALLHRRVAWAWASAAAVFHFVILGVMAILFPYHLLGIALAPLLPVERLGTTVATWHWRFRRRSTRSLPTG